MVRANPRSCETRRDVVVPRHCKGDSDTSRPLGALLFDEWHLATSTEEGELGKKGKRERHPKLEALVEDRVSRPLHNFGFQLLNAVSL